MDRWRSVAAGALVGAVVLTGCGGGGSSSQPSFGSAASQAAKSLGIKLHPITPGAGGSASDGSSSFGDGTFRVGSDVQPGTYESSGQSGCYWARLSGFSGQVSDVIANGNSDGPVVVTIEAGDAGFQSDGCGTWQGQ